MTPALKMSKLGRSALLYASQYGFRVFPLHSIVDGKCSCGSPDCTGTKPGKHPRTPRGSSDATTDSGIIANWWTKWPDANIAIATGKGLVVIDIDPRHGGDDGLVDCRRRLGELPDTVECLTGGAGRHIYLLAPEGTTVRNSASVLAPGVDVRGEGGYVVAAPSGHISGRVYTWEASSRPDEVDIAPMPTAWLDACAAKPKLRVISGGGVGEETRIVEGGRNATLFKIASSMRTTGLGESAILAALLDHNERACDPPLDPAEVKGIATSASRYAPGLSPEYQATRDAATARKAAPVETTEPSGAHVDAVVGDWAHELITTPKGHVKNSFANICTILRRAPRFAGLRYNSMRLQPEMPGEAVVDDAMLGAWREHIERTYGIAPSADTMAAALLTVSSERAYHPVQQYLGALVWDKTPRIYDVAEQYLRATPSPINIAVVTSWFIAAVARAFAPKGGTKVDNALVLVGPQGTKKSSFFRVLGGEWFSDSGIDIESKDALLQLHAAWIYELSELDSTTNRAHSGRLKAFVTSQVDTFRLPYARGISTTARTNVLVGTTNEDAFLSDPTGERRFWCVRVRGVVDIAALTRDRDQIWAEAVTRFRSDEPWWLEAQQEADLSAAAESYRVADPWEVDIARWIDANRGGAPITTAGILTGALALEIGKAQQRDAIRISGVMRKLGYRNIVRRFGSDTQRVWLHVEE